MDFINLLGSAWPAGNFWSTLIQLFDVGSYALTIILFTVVLKLVLSPLDFLQRFYTNKTTRMQAKLQPELEKLKRQYGQNQNLLYQKQTELYKKNNYSMKGSCTVMLVYMAVTLVIFITLFNSLQAISSYKIKNQYTQLQATFNQTYEQDFYVDSLGITNYFDLNDEEKLQAYEQAYYIDYLGITNYFELSEEEQSSAVETAENDLTENEVLDNQNVAILNAQDEVVLKYQEIKDSFLWINNIWQPDKPTTTQILNYAGYKSLTADALTSEATYNVVMQKLIAGENGVNSANGYYILSIIAVVVSFLSQLILRKAGQAKNKKGQNVAVAQPGMAKAMMFILPVIMLFFTLSSSAIFAMYIITNSIMATLITPVSAFISNKIEDKQELKKQNQIKVDYRR